MTSVELTRFRVPTGRAQELLDARPGMIEAFRADRHGFLDAQLIRLDDEQWLDVVYWAEPGDLDASKAKGGNLPAIQAFFAPISEVLSFEQGTLYDAPLGSAPSAVTVRYGPAPSQVGDLHLPAGGGVHPVAVLIHGGFWTAMLDRSQLMPLAHDLVARGYAVWNIDYRGLGEDGGGWPGTLEDAAAAVDILGELAAGRGAGAEPTAAAARGRLDLERVVAIGHSAGGQLALWLAARPGLPAGAPGSGGPGVRPTAAVSLAGVLDLRAADAEELGAGFGDPSVPPPAKAPAPARPELAPALAAVTRHGATAALLGGRADEVPHLYALASPLERLPLGVPQLVVHGDVDTGVPPAQSRTYATAALEQGDSVEFVEVPGADHFDVIDPEHPSWHAVVRRLPDLLQTVGE